MRHDFRVDVGREYLKAASISACLQAYSTLAYNREVVNDSTLPSICYMLFIPNLNPHPNHIKKHTDGNILSLMEMYSSSLHFSGTMFTKFLALNNHLLIPLKGATGTSSICFERLCL